MRALLKNGLSQVLFALICVYNAYSDLVSLTWDPSPGGQNITHYRVYYGAASRAYIGYVEVPAPSSTAEITLNSPGVWFFAVTAGNGAGESQFSNEILTNVWGAGTVPHAPVAKDVDLIANAGAYILTVHAKAVPGSALTIEESTDLQAWTAIYNALADQNGDITFIGVTGHSRKFYRLRYP